MTHPVAVTRREALALFLGAPLAAEACRFLPKRRIDGELRGGAVDVGHRLRGALGDSDSAPLVDVEVVIVGAGPSGLSAAWRLERLGEPRYVVLDLEERAGGTSAYGTDGVVPYPWAAHYVPVPGSGNKALIALLDEVSALASTDPPRGREEQLVREPEERLFLDGAWREGLFPMHEAGAADVAELERFTRECAALASRRDARGRPAFTIPLAASSDDPRFTELDKKSAAQYLDEENYRSARLRWYLDYACRDDYGLSLEQTSAWAMLFYFCSRVSLPEQQTAPFLTWPEGNGRLVRHLAGVAGSRLRLGQLAFDVHPREDGVVVSVLDGRAGSVVRYRARHAIVAAPQFVVRRIVRPYREGRPSHLAAFSYGSWFVANVHLGGRPRSKGASLAWDNVLYDSPSLGYVVATHQTLRDYGPTIWTYYQPLVDADPRAGRERLLALDHGQVCDAVVADLGRAHVDLEKYIERIDVYRWGHAMIRPVPGFLWGPDRRRAAEPLGSVHFAHSDLSGVALFEEAQYHGVRAAEAVLRKSGRDVPSILD